MARAHFHVGEAHADLDVTKHLVVVADIGDVTDDVLGEIIQYALSHESYMEAGVEEDTLRLNMMLQKVVEAGYLLRLRLMKKQ